MQRWVMVACFAMLAGCLSESDDLSEGTPNLNDPLGQALQPPLPLELANETWEGNNPVPPSPLGFEEVISDFEVPKNVTRLEAHFKRHHESVEVFAPNARLRTPEGEVGEQAAFSDAQYGNFDSEGTAVLEVGQPAEGDWRATYLNDGYDPRGSHEVSVIVSAYFD